MGKLLFVTGLIYALAFIISFLLAGLILLIHKVLARFEKEETQSE